MTQTLTNFDARARTTDPENSALAAAKVNKHDRSKPSDLLRGVVEQCGRQMVQFTDRECERMVCGTDDEPRRWQDGNGKAWKFGESSVRRCLLYLSKNGGPFEVCGSRDGKRVWRVR